MKRVLILTLMLGIIILDFACRKIPEETRTGCKDPSASNYDSKAVIDCNNCCIYPKKKGALLFWTNNASMIYSCGGVTIKLSNGLQSTITGYYFVAPTSCVNQFGGYFYLEEGSYTFQVISGGCNIPGGTVTVMGDRCNLARIQ
ncbi:MAG: hypothetical protein J7599_16440 [Niabella sp.]|nr:hypothetical protein [Niabella sp.]